jgi:hypothetical protein
LPFHAAKNMTLREGHEVLKKETSDVFEQARALQHRWHEEIVPTQEEVYKVCRALSCRLPAGRVTTCPTQC